MAAKQFSFEKPMMLEMLKRICLRFKGKTGRIVFSVNLSNFAREGKLTGSVHVLCDIIFASKVLVSRSLFIIFRLLFFQKTSQETPSKHQGR